jgi:NADH:ubiquinone oxidoreductase subunit 4 (subunit M)
LLPLLALIFALGIVPGVLTARMEPSVLHLLPAVAAHHLPFLSSR